MRKHLEDFVELVAGPHGDRIREKASTGSVAMAQAADRLLKQEQVALLRRTPVSVVDDDVSYAVGEITGHPLHEPGWLPPGDRAGFRLRAAQLMQTAMANSCGGNWLAAVQALGK